MTTLSASEKLSSYCISKNIQYTFTMHFDITTSAKGLRKERKTNFWKEVIWSKQVKEWCEIIWYSSVNMLITLKGHGYVITGFGRPSA